MYNRNKKLKNYREKIGDERKNGTTVRIDEEQRQQARAKLFRAGFCARQGYIEWDRWSCY